MRRSPQSEQARFSLTLFLACVLLAVAPSCVKLARAPLAAGGQTAPRGSADTPLVNINVASSEELESLPGVGRAMAARIISYRERYGRFRRPEHLLMVRGISDRRFRALSALISAE
ncbi:MAG TPA: helix-hairpin-helix domain-containing protein [Pyrinomonadaceae bacterium]